MTSGKTLGRASCALPPAGWICTRGAGHQGPCAAIPVYPETVRNSILDRAWSAYVDRMNQTATAKSAVTAAVVAGIHAHTIELQNVSDHRMPTDAAGNPLAWSSDDIERPWGAEAAFLRNLADHGDLSSELAMMLRHCAKGIARGDAPAATTEYGPSYAEVDWPANLPTLAMRFGMGKVHVQTGTSGGEPCVFLGPDESHPVAKLFCPSPEHAAAVADALLLGPPAALTFAGFRRANVARCLKWHPEGLGSWSPSDWLVAVTGELGELASLLKMRNRERDGLAGNKFSPTDKQIADELADVQTYLDLLAAALDVDLGMATIAKFNEVSERVGFPDRIAAPGVNAAAAGG